MAQDDPATTEAALAAEKVQLGAPQSVSPAVALDDPSRTQPIHASIPEVKLPKKPTTTAVVSEHTGDALQTGQAAQNSLPAILNPITLRPFTLEDLHSHDIESLLRQHTTPEAARKAREDVVKELRKLLDENEKKSKDIDREMEEKDKTREIERKVYNRKLGKDG